MSVLAIDTSTSRASVAVVQRGAILAEFASGPSPHEENLLKDVDAVLRMANVSLGDLDAIAVSEGPGSFTGLRIGLATAKGLCLAANLELRLVSTLAALTAAEVKHSGHSNNHLWVPLLDARRGEVFVGFYLLDATGTPREALKTQICTPSALGQIVGDAAKQTGAEHAFLFGEGATVYPAEAAGASHAPPTAATHALAAAVGMLGEQAIPANLTSAEPRYMRASAAEVRFPNGNPGGAFSSNNKRPS